MQDINAKVSHYSLEQGRLQSSVKAMSKEMLSALILTAEEIIMSKERPVTVPSVAKTFVRMSIL